MTGSRDFPSFAWLVVGVWLLVTLAAFAGMYALWWNREWRAYGGLSSEDSTRQVLSVVGMHPSLVDVARVVRERLPPDSSYAFRGDANHGSYLQYLLLPRLVREGSTHRILLGEAETDGAGPLVLNLDAPGWMRVVLEPVSGRVSAAEDRVAPHPLLGLLLFLAVAWGLGRTFVAVLRCTDATGAEAFGLGLAGVAALVAGSSGLTHSPFSGAWVALALSLPGFLPRFRAERQLGTGVEEHPVPAWVGVMSLSVIGCACLWSLLMAVVVGPDEWDCWANWAGKAKLLLLDEIGLRRISAFGPAEYPPIWPSLWAAAAWFGGGWNDRWPKALGPAMLALCAWQSAAVARRRGFGSSTGLFLVAIFCAAPVAPLIASWGYAEACLWFFAVCAWGAASRVDGAVRPYSPLVIATVCTATCALTKDEGALVGLVMAAWLMRAGTWRSVWTALPIAGCAVVPRVLWGAWLQHGISGGVAAGVGWSPQALDPAAWLAALRVMAGIWIDYRLWAASPVVLAALLLMGSWRGMPRRLALWVPTVAMLVCFTAVVVMRPGEISWKIGTAWGRLTLQAVLPLLFLLQGDASRWLKSFSGGAALRKGG